MNFILSATSCRLSPKLGFALTFFLLSLAPAPAQTASAVFTVRNENGGVVDQVNLGPMIQIIDGIVSLNTAIKPGAGSNWAWVDVTDNKKVLDWHTSTTVNGNNATSDGDPWAAKVSFTNLAGKIDPSMSYSFSAFNNTNATQTYSFVFGETIDPTITGDYSLYADIAGSLTRRNFDAVLTPTNVNGLMQAVLLSSDGGQTFVNPGVDVGPAQTRSAPNGTLSWGPYSSSLLGTSLATLDYWQFETSFTLTARGATGISGYAEIVPVPEPSTYAFLLGAAVIGLTLVVRRKSGIAV